MDVAKRIAELEAMNSRQLHREWEQIHGSPPPRFSPSMLRLALAWDYQASAKGGLSRATRQKLAQIAGSKTRTAVATAGTRLVREWQGQAHVVTIGHDNVIHWNDRTWRSLSEVARAITGTRWSGPAFFGLKKKVA